MPGSELRKLKRELRKQTKRSDRKDRLHSSQVSSLVASLEAASAQDALHSSQLGALEASLEAATERVSALESVAAPAEKPKFHTWCDTIKTNIGICYPKNDAQIFEILDHANEHSKKVRCLGATHSAPGLVTDGKWASGADATDQIVMSSFRVSATDFGSGTWLVAFGPSNNRRH